MATATAVLLRVSYTVYVPHASPSALAKLDWTMPAAPARASASPSVPVDVPVVCPVARTRDVQSFTVRTMSVSMRAFDSGVAIACHSSSGRHDGYAAEINTYFP